MILSNKGVVGTKGGAVRKRCSVSCLHATSVNAPFSCSLENLFGKVERTGKTNRREKSPCAKIERQASVFSGPEDPPVGGCFGFFSMSLIWSVTGLHLLCSAVGGLILRLLWPRSKVE